ncbi:hypothetical protein [Helicobacter rodentium]|uniref:hypothetical protein n=1 Tax=Helicobacter rodentium TaxID=59617 RepID=UPI00263AB6A5|nr:hypothetical protein [Helicobacter rodentium]
MLCGLLLQEKRVNNFWDILTFICVVVRSDFLWNLAFMIPLLRLFCFARLWLCNLLCLFLAMTRAV